MSNQVADTILQQLGGRRFSVLTGAKNFTCTANDPALSFRLSANSTKNRINHVKISLNASDLYDVTFTAIHGSKVKEIYEAEDVYAENLLDVFEDITGLFATLNTRS